AKPTMSFTGRVGQAGAAADCAAAVVAAAHTSVAAATANATALRVFIFCLPWPIYSMRQPGKLSCNLSDGKTGSVCGTLGWSTAGQRPEYLQGRHRLSRRRATCALMRDVSNYSAATGAACESSSTNLTTVPLCTMPASSSASQL